MASFIDSHEIALSGTSAVLVGVYLKSSGKVDASQLDELAALADTAGMREVARVTQAVDAINPRSYCGKGKVEEIAQVCRELGATVVIFDNELRPSQQQALGEDIGARVIDRTELILAIFAEHARSYQAKIAVELARLEYQLPRLRNLWTHLERQRGALGKTGGAGELQIETDRRLMRDRVRRCRRELDEIEKRRTLEVSRRKELFQAVLVGYTNAGKSTLMHALTGADVYIADKLFATLDTRTRTLELDDVSLLLSDTVGFIRNLPHSLVASFHATLSEALQADLLLHVVDASHPDAEAMMDAVEGVLRELNASDRRTLVVLNKADRIQNQATLGLLRKRAPNAILVSAKSGAGLTELRKRIADIVAEQGIVMPLEVSAGNGKLLAFLRANARILEERWEGERVFMRVQIEPRFRKQVCEMAGLPLAEPQNVESEA